LIAQSHRWQKTAVAAAAVALFGLSATGAMALSLGRITVLSALGEPLRAEIDVPDINTDEATSLKATVAAPDAFTAAGLEYNPAMSSVQTSLQRRADGRAFIRLSSDRPINEPFVDMILETSWSSGRIVRDYTMLFDPPATRKAAPAPTLAQTTPAASQPASATPAKAATSTPAPAPTPAVEPARPTKASKSTKSTPAVAEKSADKAPVEKPKSEVAAAPAEGADRVTVKNGDTASKIATRAKPAGVSLDQMLVALLRANPDAFVKENINRVRTGAVMSIPSAEQARSVSEGEASQTVLAHSKDFNEFRRNLANNAPTAAVGTAARKASGTVEAKVDDKKPATTTPDKLTLSKGAIQSKANEEKIAKERTQKEAAARAAEIAKNTAELEKIRAASATAAAAAAKVPAATAPAAPAPAAPTVAVATQSAPVATPAQAVSAPTPVATATPAAAISAPADAASAPAAAASEPTQATDVPPTIALTEPSLMDDLLDNLWLPAGAGGLLAILGGFAFWRVRQRKKNASQMDSSFLESRLQPDSFFGASGGQRVDTNSEGNSAGSSMVYSASQLDAADDVDPVAEADVYLAYGRDLQAEEILKEAARTNPGRLAIHTKLLEIFAKRRDANSYETTATQAFKLTGDGNPDWTRICNVGLDLDPNNPLYQPGGSPTDGANQESESSSFGNSTIPVMPPAHVEQAASGTDLDLDLDFSLDEEPASAISDVTGGTFAPSTPEPVSAPDASPHGALDMDFDLSDEAPAPVAEPEPVASLDMPDLSLSMDGVSLSLDEPAPAPSFDQTIPAPAFAATNTMSLESSAPPPAANDMGMMEFDISSLSLDLDTPPVAEQPAEAPVMATADPLETKLALAEEFVSIGDDDGARALIEEVISEATGEVRAKAQRALANLS
jgi:pilus assembly protein FimV